MTKEDIYARVLEYGLASERYERAYVIAEGYEETSADYERAQIRMTEAQEAQASALKSVEAAINKLLP